MVTVHEWASLDCGLILVNQEGVFTKLQLCAFGQLDRRPRSDGARGRATRAHVVAPFCAGVQDFDVHISVIWAQYLLCIEPMYVVSKAESRPN